KRECRFQRASSRVKLLAPGLLYLFVASAVEHRAEIIERLIEQPRGIARGRGLKRVEPSRNFLLGSLKSNVVFAGKQRLRGFGELVLRLDLERPQELIENRAVFRNRNSCLLVFSRDESEQRPELFLDLGCSGFFP